MYVCIRVPSGPWSINKVTCTVTVAHRQAWSAHDRRADDVRLNANAAMPLCSVNIITFFL